MKKIVVNGGRRLSGEIRASGSKNAALPLIFASMLARGRSVLLNVPRIGDVLVALDIMSELELPSHRIKLEVTETAAVVSSASLSMNMNALHDAGIMFALDDYGTGFSNAISLIEYPYSTIKIDKSVVWAAMENDDAKKVLAHTVSMLKDLNMSIVAEGVETYEQTEELISMGVDYLQGYYYSRPISGKDFIELVSIDLKM